MRERVAWLIVVILLVFSLSNLKSQNRGSLLGRVFQTVAGFFVARAFLEPVPDSVEVQEVQYEQFPHHLVNTDPARSMGIDGVPLVNHASAW